MEGDDGGVGGFVPLRDDAVQCFKEHDGKAGIMFGYGDQVARTTPRKFSTIEDTGDLKPCHNNTQKFGGSLCHLTWIWCAIM